MLCSRRISIGPRSTLTDRGCSSSTAYVDRTGGTVAQALSHGSADDAKAALALIVSIEGDIESLTAGTAYDTITRPEWRIPSSDTNRFFAIDAVLVIQSRRRRRRGLPAMSRIG